MSPQMTVTVSVPSQIRIPVTESLLPKLRDGCMPSLASQPHPSPAVRHQTRQTMAYETPMRSFEFQKLIVMSNSVTALC
jgi:hypothetical protein